MDVAAVLAKRQRVIDVVAEIGLAGELRVSERSSLDDVLSPYEPSTSFSKLDDLDELFGSIVRESALMLTIRGEITTQHRGAAWDPSVIEAIDTYTDLLDAIVMATKG